MTLIEQLIRLNQIAPEICKIKHSLDGDSFIIGEYAFWQNYGNFFAKTLSEQVRNRSALALLRDALEEVIEARGWYWEVSYPPHETTREHWANIRIGESRYFYGEAVDAAEALLTALLRALGEGKG